MNLKISDHSFTVCSKILQQAPISQSITRNEHKSCNKLIHSFSQPFAGYQSRRELVHVLSIVFWGFFVWISFLNFNSFSEHRGELTAQQNFICDVPLLWDDELLSVAALARVKTSIFLHTVLSQCRLNTKDQKDNGFYSNTWGGVKSEAWICTLAFSQQCIHSAAPKQKQLVVNCLAQGRTGCRFSEKAEYLLSSTTGFPWRLE